MSSQNIIPDEVMEMSDPHLVTEDSALQRSAIFEGISSVPKKKQSKVSSMMNFTYSDHLAVTKRHAPWMAWKTGCVYGRIAGFWRHWQRNIMCSLSSISFASVSLFNLPADC
jgi:hypothetical protein